MVVYEEFGDGVTNVFLATTDGRNQRRLTNVDEAKREYCVRPRPSIDGNRVVMACAADLNGQNTDGNQEVFLLDGVDFALVTGSPNTVRNSDPNISGDGQTIAFTSNGNYTGGNVDGSDEIFLWRTSQALQQITRSADDSRDPRISADGQRVLSRRVVQGGDSGSPSLLYLYDVGTGSTTQLTFVDPSSPQLSRDGQWILFISRADLVGSNPNGFPQLYAQRIGGAVRQLTQISDLNTSVASFAANASASRIAVTLSRFLGPTTTGESMLVTNSGAVPLPQLPGDGSSLSFDSAGRLLAFLSSEDPVRQNPSHTQQLFVAMLPFEADTPTPTRAPTKTPTPTPLPALASDVGATDTSIFLNVTNPFPFFGVVRIGDELISYTSESGNVLFGLTRGACSTTTSAHTAGTLVNFVSAGCPPTPTPTATPVPTPCVGDCNGSRDVTVNELLTMLNIALNNADISACMPGDSNHNGSITISEILAAVNKAMSGCG